MSKKTKSKNRLPERQSIFINEIRPKTKKQSELIKSINDNEITIAMGPAGSGKTFISLATSLELIGDKFKKIILCKSVTNIPGEEIGYIPGNIMEKMEPYIMSYIWNIDKMCGPGFGKSLIDKKLIEVLPLAYIRGLSIDNSIVIVDEAQNIDKHTFKTIMTRIGTDSKYIFLGDIEQIDRKKKSESCLEPIVDIFKDSPIIGTVEFTDEDCVRNPIIPKILQALREHGI